MQRFAVSLAPILLTLCFSAVTSAQLRVDLYTAADLAAREQALKAKVDPASGSAGTTQQYANHLTMFILREKDGQAERHLKLADVFFATDGAAELWTGGTMLNSKATAPDEERGDGLQGATKAVLHKGDIVHIPAGLPHQLRLPPGGHFAYFVVKSREVN